MARKSNKRQGRSKMTPEERSAWLLKKEIEKQKKENDLQVVRYLARHREKGRAILHYFKEKAYQKLSEELNGYDNEQENDIASVGRFKRSPYTNSFYYNRAQNRKMLGAGSGKWNYAADDAFYNYEQTDYPYGGFEREAERIAHKQVSELVRTAEHRFITAVDDNERKKALDNLYILLFAAEWEHIAYSIGSWELGFREEPVIVVTDEGLEYHL